jgi:hypothetical protein
MVKFYDLAMMKLSDLETEILLRNYTPLDDFLGLSPTDIHYLVYEPYDKNSLVQLKKNLDDATLDKLAFFRIAEELLKIIARDKFIKLTPLGALPKKTMVELYAYKFIPEELVEKGISKLTRQEDSISIQSARFVTEAAGLAKKVNGKLSLTKNGEKIIRKENREDLFFKILSAFTEKFNWGFNDGYPEQPVGQFGWAFSISCLTSLEMNGDQVIFMQKNI